MRVLALTLGLLITVSTSGVMASDTATDTVFGQALMTSEELTAYKSRLAQCKTSQEREDVKAAHQDRMVQRARWKGLVIRPEMTLAGND